MDKEALQKLESKIDSLDSKLDKYHEQSIKNTTDIAWLKRGWFGTIFTFASALFYKQVGGP